MNLTTRRQLISGLTALSAASIIGCTTKKDAIPEVSRVSSTGRSLAIDHLNVIVHGLVAMVVLRSAKPMEGIQLLIPEFNDAVHPEYSHQYLYGNLTYGANPASQLQQLQKGFKYNLTGVNAGKCPAPSDFLVGDSSMGSDVVFDDQGIKISYSEVRTIILPWPSTITSLKLMERADGQPAVNAKAGTALAQRYYWIPIIHILTYETGGQTPKFLYNSQDTGWVPSPGPIIPSYSNLQFFAEPDQGVPADHPPKAFSTLMGGLSKGGTIYNKSVTFGDISSTTLRVIPSAAPPSISKQFDLLNLPDLMKGGPLANCLKAVVFQ